MVLTESLLVHRVSSGHSQSGPTLDHPFLRRPRRPQRVYLTDTGRKECAPLLSRTLTLVVSFPDFLPLTHERFPS